MTIVWFSRHQPLQAQMTELSRLWPGHRFIPDGDKFMDADDIIQRLRIKRPANDDMEIVIVAPLSVLQRLIERGLRPLWPEMREIISNSAEDAARFNASSSILPARVVEDIESYVARHRATCVSAPRGRGFEFIRFRRLVAIEMRFEEIG